MKKVILTMLLCASVAAPAYANKPHDQEDKAHMASRLIDKMDNNADGQISMNEHEAFSAKMFYDVDTNKDRMLSQSEIAAYKLENKEDWAARRNGANYRYQQ